MADSSLRFREEWRGKGLAKDKPKAGVLGQFN